MKIFSLNSEFRKTSKYKFSEINSILSEIRFTAALKQHMGNFSKINCTVKSFSEFKLLSCHTYYTIYFIEFIFFLNVLLNIFKEDCIITTSSLSYPQNSTLFCNWSEQWASKADAGAIAIHISEPPAPINGGICNVNKFYHLTTFSSHPGMSVMQ